jgi:hypothetical protein
MLNSKDYVASSSTSRDIDGVPLIAPYYIFAVLNAIIACKRD